jgi:CelD/BcsL family acetyltransferase involved in cellulose biosynthesis
MARELSVRIATTGEEVHSLLRYLREGALSAERDPWFSSYEWLSSWWECFGDEREPFAVALLDGERPVALAPLCVGPKRMLGLRMRALQFIGGSDSDYADVAVAPAGREEAIAKLAATLAEQRGMWEIAELLHVRCDSPNLHPLLGSLRKLGYLTVLAFWKVSPYVAIKGDFQEYLGRLSKNHQYDLRRKERRLQSAGPIRFRILGAADPDVRGHFEQFWEMRRARLAQAGRPQLYDECRHRALYWKLLERSEPGHGVHFSVLLCGERPIAYHFGFIAGKKLYYYTPTFDPEFHPFSPGKLLIKYLLADAFGRGCEEFDFLLGEEPYKYAWTSHSRGVCNLFVLPRTVRGIALYLWFGRVKPALKRQAWLVRLVRSVRGEKRA